MRPTLIDVAKRLPEAAIDLSKPHKCRDDCGAEVLAHEDRCAYHGGAAMTIPMLRRYTLRGIRFAICEMIRCEKCRDIPLNEVRCNACAYVRGTAMGIGALAENMGWKDDSEPLMALIGIEDPGWIKRYFPELWAPE